MEQRHWRGPRSSSCPGPRHGDTRGRCCSSRPQPPRRCLPFPALRGGGARPPGNWRGAALSSGSVLFAFSPRTRPGAGSTGVTEADTWRVNGGRTKGFVSTALFSGHCHGCSRSLNRFSRGLCDLHELPLGTPFPKVSGFLLLRNFRVL